MEKDFDSWNIRKKTLDTKGTLRQVHEGEIWWASLGLNIGSEQDGKNNLFERPVLIIKRYNENMALILPLSSKNKISKYHYKVNVAHWQATVLLAQPRLISTKRITRKIIHLRKNKLEPIVRAFIQSLQKNETPPF